MMWILIVLVYAGPFAKGDSVALTNIPGFRSEADCVAAGQRAGALVSGTAKETRYVCIAQKQP